MTTSQCERIAEMRLQNYSYSFIGRALDLSPNTVKSICRRQGFPAKGPRKTKEEKQNTILCKNCRKPLGQNGRKDRLFCTESCRIEWWKNNRKVIEKKSYLFSE